MAASTLSAPIDTKAGGSTTNSEAGQDAREIGDVIIRRSDGSPLYHLAVVVDDIDLGVSYVIRGQDHHSNTPFQLAIYRALEAPVPQMAHVPLIVGKNGKKLSKRKDPVSVQQFREEGYLPEAMRKAELIVEAYNRMGYHAMAVGSFDIAAGLDSLKKLEERADFVFLSANLLDTKTGKPVFKPHIIVKKGGSRIGVIGLTQATMSKTYLSKVAPGTKIEEPEKAVRRSLEALRGQTDTVIVLSHLREESNFEIRKSLLEALPCFNFKWN